MSKENPKALSKSGVNRKTGPRTQIQRSQHNKHYAGEMSAPDMPSNGLKSEQLAWEGTDQFIQEDRYFSAYSAYFAFKSASATCPRF